PAIDAEGAPALGAVEVERQHVEQWMPHEVDGHAGIPVELLLERQDREHSTHAAGHLPNTAAPPRPELGRDEVDDGDAGTAGDARQPQVELRKIDHDEHARPLFDEPGLWEPGGG